MRKSYFSRKRFFRLNRVGFTALEIVVVLVILGVFSTFAIVSYSSYRKQASIKNGTRTVETALSTARALAINQNANFEVTIDIENNQFWIDKLDRRGEIAKPKFLGVNWLPDGVLFSEIRKNNISYYSGLVRILFRPNGASEYVSIYLIGENMDGSLYHNYYAIRVYPSTGLTHVYKNERK
ncbi:prepilin-type N-terminal cleavage/methylation domain-containing protein [Candidatus Sumerlaeota bacterium]|nr:prepilin-type N-terminal cleavage/methylation domain-containing protein [Candidatus Sumerlaeota bacterium]